MNHSQLITIAKIRTPFKEKFGIPRQANLVTAGEYYVEFESEFSDPDFIKDIEQHSHLWLLFQFHQNIEQGYKASVRPPRLGGNQKTGVFATRSSFRPNGIGMSAVKLLHVETSGQQPKIFIESADLLDGTPIIDIKPYIPYSDLIPEAHSEMATSAPEQTLNVLFSETALQQLKALESEYPQLDLLITQVLNQDPRPAYKKTKADSKIYGIRLYDLDIKWQVEQDNCHVLQIN